MLKLLLPISNSFSSFIYADIKNIIISIKILKLNLEVKDLNFLYLNDPKII